MVMKNATARYTGAFLSGLRNHLQGSGNAIIIQLTGPDPSVQFEVGGLGTAVFPIPTAASLAAWSAAVVFFQRPGNRRYHVVETPPGEFRVEGTIPVLVAGSYHRYTRAELAGGEL